MCPNGPDCKECYCHGQCPDSYSLGTECRKPATTPLWFKSPHPTGADGQVQYYCAEHAASILRRLPSAFTDVDPKEG